MRSTASELHSSIQAPGRLRHVHMATKRILWRIIGLQHLTLTCAKSSVTSNSGLWLPCRCALWDELLSVARNRGLACQVFCLKSHLYVLCLTFCISQCPVPGMSSNIHSIAHGNHLLRLLLCHSSRTEHFGTFLSTEGMVWSLRNCVIHFAWMAHIER